MKNTRWIAGSLGLCGVLLLGGCAAPGAYGDYGSGGYGYGYGNAYGGYARSYYDPVPVVPAPIYIQGGGYYDRPGYYGRPSYYDRPAYGAAPGYGGARPTRPDGGYRPGDRPGRGNGNPQQYGPGRPSNAPFNASAAAREAQRAQQERPGAPP